MVQASLDFNDFPEYDRTAWSIFDFDTEEPAEGDANKGTAVAVLDGENTTFWSTQLTGGEAPMPHWLAVDMGSSQTVHGLSFVGRQSDNNGKPKDVFVFVSEDGVNWEEAGALVLSKSNS